jgi:hypothetical protein
MLSNSDEAELARHNQLQHNLQRQQPAAMSYSYGPTMVYPVSAFSIGEPFGFEAKENYAALQQGMHAVPAKVSHTVPSRHARGPEMLDDVACTHLWTLYCRSPSQCSRTPAVTGCCSRYSFFVVLPRSSAPLMRSTSYT